MIRLRGQERGARRTGAGRLGVAVVLGCLAGCGGGDGPNEGPAERVPGHSYFSPSGNVEYIVGDAPLLLTAPHGGDLRPASMPDRQIADTNTDDYTQELVRAIDTAMVAGTGHHPHVVICRIHRVKLDCNRDLAEAAMGDPEAGAVWVEWHEMIDSAKAAIVRDFGSGLMLDIHGHGHAIARIEAGYALTGEQLDLPDEILAQPSWQDSTSIRALQTLSGRDLAAMLRGDAALGTLLADRGFRTVPSRDEPGPAGAPYFTGGYNTRRHGSQESGSISAIQMELYRPGLRDTPATRHAFATALVEALQTYLLVHAGLIL